MPASLRRLVGDRSKDVWDTLEHGIASNAPDHSPKPEPDGNELACGIRPNR